MFDELAEQLGGLGVLVNNAGSGHRDRVLDLDYETWRHVLATDLDGPFLCSKHAAKLMRDAGHGGRIINITSVHEHVPRLGAAAYCSAKAGLGMLTKVLALELAEDGILVTSVAPGEIATPMTGKEEQQAFAAKRPGNPLGRPGHVNEIASVVGFLASPRSTYVTGTSITVDGGLTLMAAHGHDEADAGWRGSAESCGRLRLRRARAMNDGPARARRGRRPSGSRPATARGRGRSRPRPWPGPRRAAAARARRRR